jgi:hypothetical protein
MLIKYLILGVGMFFVGSLFMWMWTRADVIRYKELYEKLVKEKRQMQLEHAQRLDMLGRSLGLDTSSRNFDPSKFVFGDMNNPAASGEVVNYDYE